MNESHKNTLPEEGLQRTLGTREYALPVPPRDSLESLLTQVIRRRPYIVALALISPGGKLWASALPDGVEAETVAAMAAPVALLGRRVALEQLGSDMRQAHVEGEGGYAILRTIGEAAVLLTIASADANLALVLHDVDMLEGHVARVMGITAREAGKWTEAASSIERLRRLVSEGQAVGMPEDRLGDLRSKLESLDLGFFPERVNALRARLQYPHHLKEVEAELLTLEKDVMVALEQDITPPVLSSVIAGQDVAERVGQQSSFLRRALKWLASMIESED
ncbi:MAG: roadblock/LC7 domain-containing protein [Anaerolineae bacterium]|nr:roadblock/LC7 domain-containing protein [Anaerolineae bacterium]